MALGLLTMGPLANTGPLGPGLLVTRIYLPGCGVYLPLHCLWQPEEMSVGQRVLGIILFWNLSWCLDFKLVTCQSPGIWELGFLWLIKCPLCLRGDIKYHSIFALKYSWLVHEMSLYGTSKAHKYILSWAFDILIFGQWKYYLFNPQSTYLCCWLDLCCCFKWEV